VAVEDGCVCITRPLAAPATSRNVPKFELVETVTTVAVPLTFKLPLAKGVPAVGRTRAFCQVNLQVTPLMLLLLTVNVICVLVTEFMATEVPLETPLMLFPPPPLPLSLVIKTVGAVPPVSNIKPLGAFKSIVPGPTSPLVFSE